MEAHSLNIMENRCSLKTLLQDLPEIMTVAPASITPLFGRTQYLRGAVVFTLKHTFLSEGFFSLRLVVTTSVKGPEEHRLTNKHIVNTVGRGRRLRVNMLQGFPIQSCIFGSYQQCPTQSHVPFLEPRHRLVFSQPYPFSTQRPNLNWTTMYRSLNNRQSAFGSFHIYFFFDRSQKTMLATIYHE